MVSSWYLPNKVESKICRVYDKLINRKSRSIWKVLWPVEYYIRQQPLNAKIVI